MKRIILLLTLIIVLPLRVSAATLELKCPNKAAPNTKIECNITTEDQLKGLKLVFSTPNVFTIDKTIPNWANYYKNNEGLVLINPQNAINENISKVSFNISNEAIIHNEYNINLTNIEASDINHNLVRIEDAVSIINIVSDDNTLSNLTLSNGTLTPKFDKDITSYKSTINKEKTTINATPTNEDSKIEGNIGEIELNYGINNLTINVTSELGTTKTYTIVITRPFPTQETTTEKNNSTTDSKNKNNDNNTTKSNKKSFSDFFKKKDSNKIVIPKNSDSSLKEIIIKGYKIDFNPNKFKYNLTVNNNVTNLEITAVPNNNKAKVEIIKPDILAIGKNIITITVTAEDGTLSKYELEVTRKKEKPKKPKNPITTESIKSNKEVSIFPSIPLAIIILIILLILLILFIIIKRIFKKE
ncbi:MAG: cadherin-like beta sandwich domain-containing protein [Bacilli bacterium]|nr:cadherin-like beta sandwich domain-containing protein [Bacilli bacterium]